VDRKKQLWLPKLKKVKRIKKKRQTPQPRIRKYRIVKKYELLHRPFDLRFRGKLNKWLEGFQQKDDFAEIINLYFFPQKPNNKWLNQEEVIEKTDFTSKKKLRAVLIQALVTIWKTKS
jgi:hypothetical protein